jgi:rhamnose transport system substrate-binding protein
MREGPFKVAFTPKVIGIPYFDAILQGAQKAADELGDELIYTAPNEMTLEAQIPVIDTLIDQKVDGIMLAATSFEGVAPVCKKALDAGIPIVTFDADVLPESRTMFINQASFEGIGRTMSSEIAEMMDYEGELAIMSGSPQSPNQNLWIDWMLEELKDEKYADIKLVDVVYSDSVGEKAYNKMVDLITAYPNLKGIAIPDSVALISSCAAIEDKGMSGKIKVTGLSTPSSMKDYILNGTCERVYLWNNPVYGYLTGYCIHNLLTGEFKGEIGETLSTPDPELPEWTVEADENGYPFILLGPPFLFDINNIEEWAEIF